MIKVYTARQVATMMVKTGHYGPWSAEAITNARAEELASSEMAAR